MIHIAIILAVLITILAIFLFAKSNRKRIELEADFIVGGVDNVCESFNIGKNVDVSGILGSDFFEKYKYVIDFDKHTIRHGWRSLPFKEAMKLLGIPFIVLWQNERKYIFIVDTGSTYCHISSKALDTLDFDLDTEKLMSTIGAGGVTSTSGMAKIKLYYE
jgi:hypothetical protein